MLNAVGGGGEEPKDWVVEGRVDPLVVKELAYLDHVTGTVLCSLVQQLTGARWNWRRERRSRRRRLTETQTAAERLEIPIDAVWMSKHPDPPNPFERSGLKTWIHKGGFWLWNDGLVVMDFSRVSGIDIEPAEGFVSELVATVLRDPEVWNVVGSYEGYFQVRVRGRAKVWLSRHRSTKVDWRRLRNGCRIADVSAKVQTSATAAAGCGAVKARILT